MSEEIAKQIICTISTYKDLKEELDFIIETFNKAISIFTTDEIKPQYLSLYFTNDKFKLLKYSKRNWNRAIEELKDKNLETIALDFQKAKSTEDDSQIAPDALMQIIICARQKSIEFNPQTYEPNEVRFVFNPTLFILDNENILKWIKHICFHICCISGFVEYLPTSSMYGACVTTKFDSITEPNAFMLIDNSKYLRGYFWINILTDEHIKKLGGIDYVKQNIPYVCYEDVKMSDGRVAYIFQTMHDFKNFQSSNYLRLKEFLKPILEAEDIRRAALVQMSEGDKWDERRLVFSEEQKVILKEQLKRPAKELRKEVEDERNLRLGFENNKTKINTFKRREFAVSTEADITALNFQITFTSIKENQLNSLKNLIDSWADVGLFGGYKGQLHNFSGASIIEKGVEAVMDMGNADIEVAIGTLQDILNQFAKLESLEISELNLF